MDVNTSFSEVSFFIFSSLECSPDVSDLHNFGCWFCASPWSTAAVSGAELPSRGEGGESSWHQVAAEGKRLRSCFPGGCCRWSLLGCRRGLFKRKKKLASNTYAPATLFISFLYRSLQQVRQEKAIHMHRFLQYVKFGLKSHRSWGQALWRSWPSWWLAGSRGLLAAGGGTATSCCRSGAAQLSSRALAASLREPPSTHLLRWGCSCGAAAAAAPRAAGTNATCCEIPALPFHFIRVIELPATGMAGLCMNSTKRYLVSFTLKHDQDTARIWNPVHGWSAPLLWRSCHTVGQSLFSQGLEEGR